jgi:hypothetical protein
MAKNDRAYDTFIRQQLQPRLQPGEAIACTGFLIERSLAWASVGMIGLIGKGYHFAAITDRRIFLIATQFALTGVKMLNEGVVEIALDDLASVQVQGSAIARTVVLAQRNGTTRTLRYSGVFKVTPTQERFVDMLSTVQHRGIAPVPVASTASGLSSGQGAAGEASPSAAEQLKQLLFLHRSGVLTDQEYGATRAELVKRL